MVFGCGEWGDCMDGDRQTLTRFWNASWILGCELNATQSTDEKVIQVLLTSSIDPGDVVTMSNDLILVKLSWDFSPEQQVASINGSPSALAMA